MKALVTYLFDDFRNKEEARFLQRLLGLFVVYKCLYLFLNFTMLFSDSGIIYQNDVHLSWWRQAVFLLFNTESTPLSFVFVIVAFISALAVIITPKFSRVLFFLLWLSINNINNKIFSTLSGGDHLLQHFLFFSIFLSGNYTEGKWNDINKVFHNTGLVALKIQLCFVYAFAGYTKLLDPDWMNGTAVSDVFQINDFSLPAYYGVESGFFTMLLNYTVIAYQLLFSVFVWIQPLKKWFLLIGVVQHLFIAFILGLPSFGLIMIVAYAVFHKPNIKLVD